MEARRGREGGSPAGIRRGCGEAAASSTTASFESIAAAVSREVRPTRATIGEYREALTQLWLLDEVPAWTPSGRELT